VAASDRSTLNDVALAAGVSRAAAGNVLLGSGGNTIRVSPKTALRVRRVATKLGYCANRAAQQLRGKPSQLVSVIMSLDAPAVELDRLIQLERQGCREGLQLTVSAIPSGDPLSEIQRVVDTMAGRGVDGFIFVTPDENIFAQGFPDLHGVPAVYNGVGDRFPRQPAVGMDLIKGGRLCAEHLLRRGRRRMGTAYLGPNIFSARRLDGIAQGLEGARADRLTTLFLERQAGIQELPESLAERVVDEVVIGGKADALMVENDYWAARVLNVMKRRGVRVPDDVALVGYNNLDLGGFTDPTLTTVEEHNDRIAEAMLQLLLKRMAGEKPGRQVLIEPELVVRASA
jgi:DNA-binding LacI/PurR family transcriptional regulator